jgi:hypothetical protein
MNTGNNMITKDALVKEFESAVEFAYQDLIKAAVAAEREACAKLCENRPVQQDRDVRDECAAAIRAREAL